MKDEIKMAVDLYFENKIYKGQNAPVYKQMMLSEFIRNQQIEFSNYLHSDKLLSFEVMTAAMDRISLIDESTIVLYTEDVCMEDFKKDGIRKLRFLNIQGNVKEFLKGEKEFNDDMESIHELIE